MSRRVRAMKRRLGSLPRPTVPGAMRFNPEDLASISSELAWMTRLADPKLRSLSARLVMAVFDDDQIHRETGDYAVSPGLPAPAGGGWRAVADFAALSAVRTSAEALAALRGLERDGYLEQMEQSGTFRPVQVPRPVPRHRIPSPERVVAGRAMEHRATSTGRIVGQPMA